MRIAGEWRAIGLGLLVALVLGACSGGGGAPPAPVATAVSEIPTSSATLEPRFNPTAAVGGAFNASNAVPADDIKAVLASIPQASQLQITANSSPPGARGPDVTTVAITAQDTSGLLKSLDMAAKRTLGDALLTAAGTTWPKAGVSLLVSDSTTGGSQIIGSRTPGGANTVIVS
jgi:hypothetical protein